ncbi:MAG: hypothetical protein AAF533_02970 [Acidobacteriota bacterium]
MGYTSDVMAQRSSETSIEQLEALPGAELVSVGLRDLIAGDLTDEALLVLIGAPRLRRIGLDVPSRPDVDHPEHALYLRLDDAHGAAAHGKYNGLIRRLVSFERAAECLS